MFSPRLKGIIVENEEVSVLVHGNTHTAPTHISVPYDGVAWVVLQRSPGTQSESIPRPLNVTQPVLYRTSATGSIY